MNQADFGVALMLFLVVSGFTLYVRFGPYRRERRKARRYRFFAIRDRLVWLVAEEKLVENDPAFQFLYEGVTRIIPAAKPLGLKDVVATLKASQFVDEQRLRVIKNILEHKDKEVREVAADLFSAIVEVLLARSLFVRLARIGFHGYFFTKQARHVFGRVFKTQNEAYEVYRTVGPIARQLQAA